LISDFKSIILHLQVTTGTFILALKGQNINSPGQRPGIIMVKNIQALLHPPRSHRFRWERGG
jgi:hypothetical protein